MKAVARELQFMEKLKVVGIFNEFSGMVITFSLYTQLHG